MTTTKTRSLTIFFTLLLFTVFGSTAQAERLSEGTSNVTTTAEKKLFDGIVATPSKLSEKERRVELLKSVEAIEDKGLMFTPADCRKRNRCKRWKKKDTKSYRFLFKKCQKRLQRCYKKAKRWQKRRERIVTAALYAEKKTGIDATFMIAVGRMESDFRPLQLIDSRCGQRLAFGGRRACGADCGITQHRIYGKAAYVRRMCKKYAKNFKLVFLKSAQELAHHVKYCSKRAKYKRHHPLNRCVMNRYNQGTFYKTRGRCKSYFKCNRMFIKNYPSKEIWYGEYKGCKRARRKCYNTAAYWTKLSCFYYGAKNKVRSKKSCRKCYSIGSIASFYPTKKKPVKPAKKLLVSQK